MKTNSDKHPYSISISLDVWKALQQERRSKHENEDEILRRVLGIRGARVAPSTSSEKDAFVCKNRTFPAGTRFRATYKGRLHEAHVEKGALVYKGKRFKSPSGAAHEATKIQINGWIWWKCLVPGSKDWKVLKKHAEDQEEE